MTCLACQTAVVNLLSVHIHDPPDFIIQEGHEMVQKALLCHSYLHHLLHFTGHPLKLFLFAFHRYLTQRWTQQLSFSFSEIFLMIHNGN